MPDSKRRLSLLAAATMGCCVLCGHLRILTIARADSAAAEQSNKAKAETVVTKGLDYLKTQQKPDGGWQTSSDPPGMTALVLKAFTQDPEQANNKAVIDKGFARLLADQKPDGSIGDTLANYNTAIAITALAAAREPEHKSQLDKAVAFLRELQWGGTVQGVKDDMRVDPSNPNYGGFGYGGGQSKHADLSNTQTALDALHDAGLKPEDPAFQAAIKFLSRSQNRSETNDQKWSGDDGGFVYTPGAGGSSPAGEFNGPDGQRMLRSYGSMTYAGLKSMIYAGLSHDDPRVKAAWAWIQKNWALDDNPGMAIDKPSSGDSGLYYYYHTMARALHAYGEPIVVDAKGVRHDWREELIAKIACLQKPDGSWAGSQRWMESRPVLSSGFALLALQEAQADLREHPAK
jgi:squalene-hopene/tetraprenyl-beta-curcumene cyclase